MAFERSAVLPGLLKDTTVPDRPVVAGAVPTNQRRRPFRHDDGTTNGWSPRVMHSGSGAVAERLRAEQLPDGQRPAAQGTLPL